MKNVLYYSITSVLFLILTGKLSKTSIDIHYKFDNEILQLLLIVSAITLSIVSIYKLFYYIKENDDKMKNERIINNYEYNIDDQIDLAVKRDDFKEVNRLLDIKYSENE